MPKRKTFEQLERALKRAKNKSARTKSAHDSYIVASANHASVWRGTIADLTSKLEAETFRCYNLTRKLDEIQELALRDDLKTLASRAEAAETNLVHFRKALEDSNTVNLGLLNLAKMAATPFMFTKPEGITTGNPFPRRPHNANALPKPD